MNLKLEAFTSASRIVQRAHPKKNHKRPQNGYSVYSGVSSTGGIATGYTSVSTHLISTNHEALTTLEVGMSPSKLPTTPRCLNSQLPSPADNSCYKRPRSTSSPCADNTHPSVLPHEMLVIDPGENPSRMFHFRPWSDLVNNDHVDIFILMHTVMIFKPVRLNPRHSPHLCASILSSSDALPS